eukprot:m.25380 g.25380  ORF g.25380 m.25380 type:complete len:341 (+) comp9843_c1_seq1:169-1191(+)
MCSQSLDEIEGSITLFHEFLLRCLHLFAREAADRQTSHNGNGAILDGDGMRINDTRRNIIGSVREDAHGCELALWSAEPPGVHVVSNSLGSRHGARKLAGLDDCSATCLDRLDELAMKPLVIGDGISDSNTGAISINNVSVFNVRVLCGGMVTPDNDVLNLACVDTSLLSNHSASTALIQVGQSGELRLGNAWGVLGSNESIGVGGVTHNNNLDRLLGDFVNSSALNLEDACILLQQILALHTFTARDGTNQHGSITVLESHKGIVCRDDRVDELVSTVSQLHDDTHDGTHHRRNIQKVQVDRLVCSEDITLADEGKQGIGDLASSTSHADIDGGLHLGD